MTREGFGDVQESGSVTVAAVAAESRLPVNILLPVLTARLGTVIPGKLAGGLLYTAAHLARVKARPCRIPPPAAAAVCGASISPDQMVVQQLARRHLAVLSKILCFGVCLV